jgi:hypothetical protein
MKTIISLFTFIILLTSCNRVYYISKDGDDENSGTSPGKPWETINKLNEINLSPGTRVLFEGGKVYKGTIRLTNEDKGTYNKRISISSYGKGRAIIDGKESSGLIAEDCDYLTISDLIVKGSGRKTGNITDGILFSECDSIEVNNVEIFGFQHSGLHVHKSRNAVIKHVYAHHNGFAGIHVTGRTIRDENNYDNETLYIGHCIAENNPGDPTVTDNHSGNGILASSVKGGIIEYCEAFNNGWDMPWTGNGPVGIWIWDCTDFIIQYCISHDNKTAPGAADGGGFDFDGGVSGSILQYNLSYNNEGPGIGLFEFGAAKAWENNIVRYNISQNDGTNGAGSLAIWKGETGNMRNCEVYHNTFYNCNPNGPSLWLYNHWPGFNFRNNIFVYNGSFVFNGHYIEDEVFQGNIYWNLAEGPGIEDFQTVEEWALSTGKEILNGKVVGKFQDPLLYFPGRTSLTDPKKLDASHLPEYAPVSGSPVIDNALDLSLFNLEKLQYDITGNKIPVGNKYDIGAIEFLPD